MGFEEYLESNLGSYKDDLTKEQLAQLKGAYDKLLIWQNTANITFQKGIEGKSKVDFTNDYEKAMEQVQNAGQKLSDIMNGIKLGFGIENPEDISKHSM
jgi:hypothetical protein